MGRPIKWTSQPAKSHEAEAKEVCRNYGRLKAAIAEKEKMLAEIKQEWDDAISDLERMTLPRNCLLAPRRTTCFS